MVKRESIFTYQETIDIFKECGLNADRMCGHYKGWIEIDGKEDCQLFSGNYLVSGISFLIDSTDTPVQQITLVRQGISVPVFDATTGEQPFSNSQFDQNVLGQH